MRKEYAIAVRKQFEARLKQVLPLFELSKGEEHAYPGGRCYRWCLATDLSLYIYITPGVGEKFTVEIAWSEKGRFPELKGAMFQYNRPVDGEYLSRLGMLCDSKRDKWWFIEPELSLAESADRLIQALEGHLHKPPVEQYLPNVPIVVEDAIQHILQYAMPYFEKIAAEHGYYINSKDGTSGKLPAIP